MGGAEAAASPSAAIRQRAVKLCHWAIARGTLAIRSHVDVCDAGCWPSRPCWRSARSSSPTSTCSWWPFPRTATARIPAAMENLIRALDMGVDVVGGIPHFERTMDQGAAIGGGSVRAGCGSRAAGGHALRRERRSAVAAHRDPGRIRPSGWGCRAGSPARI